jgi:hypothetical protein
MDDWDLCSDMECPRTFREPNCMGNCPRFDEHMKMTGSIYMILPDDSAAFVGRLPGQLTNSLKTTANKVEPAGGYPTLPETIPPLEQA